MTHAFARALRGATFAKAIAVALVGWAVPATADSGFSFGVVPQFEARRLSEIWTPIMAQLEEITGEDFQMVGSPRIPEFEQAFARGEFDFAYMNPYHALLANSSEGYEPIIRDGDRKLFGVLVVAADAPYQTVEDLAGQTIAFPAPNALGASLLMRADLDRNHGLDFTPDFVNTHSSAYLNVVLGEAAAAGGVMGTFNALDEDVRSRLRIIYETERLAPHPIVVHPRVPADIAKKVQDAFLQLAATPEGAELLSQIPMRRAVPATMADYDQLSDMGLENYYVGTGVN